MRNVLYKNGKVLFVDEEVVLHTADKYACTTVTVISDDGKILDQIHIDPTIDTFADRRDKNHRICDFVADYFKVPRIGKLPNGFAAEHVLAGEDDYNSETQVFLGWELLTDFRYSPQGINRDKEWRIKLL